MSEKNNNQKGSGRLLTVTWGQPSLSEADISNTRIFFHMNSRSSELKESGGPSSYFMIECGDRGFTVKSRALWFIGSYQRRTRHGPDGSEPPDTRLRKGF